MLEIPPTRATARRLSDVTRGIVIPWNPGSESAPARDSYIDDRRIPPHPKSPGSPPRLLPEMWKNSRKVRYFLVWVARLSPRTLSPGEGVGRWSAHPCDVSWGRSWQGVQASRRALLGDVSASRRIAALSRIWWICLRIFWALVWVSRSLRRSSEVLVEIEEILASKWRLMQTVISLN